MNVSLFLIKSLLSLLMTVLAVVSMATMFEIFGRSEKKCAAERMIKYHRASGRVYFILFAVIMYFCLSFIVLTKAELSTRAAFHGIFALMIFLLFTLKLSFVRVYRRYYENVKIIGLLMALLTFGLVGTSAGYYLLVSEFGTDTSYDTILQYRKQFGSGQRPAGEEAVQTYSVKKDSESIGRGKNLFDSKCRFCHHDNSTETLVGPGLKGVLKRSTLPISNRPASPENIIRQFKQPFNRMPSFEYLSDAEIADVIAYMNTL